LQIAARCRKLRAARFQVRIPRRHRTVALGLTRIAARSGHAMCRFHFPAEIRGAARRDCASA
jgi:hypothetical protein